MKLLPDTVESLKIAWSAIIANKARGGLTTLGIIIGIVAVTTTMTAFNGIRSAFMQGAGAIGADVVYVSRMPWVVMNDFFQYRNRPNIDLAEAEALERAFEGRAIVNPTMFANRNLRYRSRTLTNVDVIGTSHKMTIISDRMPSLGRFLMDFDVRYKKFVVILGHEVAGVVQRRDVQPRVAPAEARRPHDRADPRGVQVERGGRVARDDRLGPPGRQRALGHAGDLDPRVDPLEQPHELVVGVA